jgi:hypothetical protein
MAFIMIKIPKIIKQLFFNQIWNIPNSENTIYTILTFNLLQKILYKNIKELRIN